MIFDLFEIWRRSSRSPPPHNIFTSIFQRTQTNESEGKIQKKPQLPSVINLRGELNVSFKPHTKALGTGPPKKIEKYK